MIESLIDQINLFAFKAQLGGSSFLAATKEELTTDDEALDSSFASIMDSLNKLIDEIWIWVIVGLVAVVAIWGAYIGIRIAIAHKNEDKINSRDMLKNLFIGIVVIFVVAMGVPLIIKALYAWAC